PRDVAAAFAWVKKNIGTRGGDESRVFLVGHSSGAHLVALLGADGKYLEEFHLSKKSIAGVVPIGSLIVEFVNQH
ncbi:MAG: carboxylesterase family protein, partial [Acidobacteria bacterium]|nr:carboxylesterase family protein [Acidobacteriota bacterium]